MENTLETEKMYLVLAHHVHMVDDVALEVLELYDTAACMEEWKTLDAPVDDVDAWRRARVGDDAWGVARRHRWGVVQQKRRMEWNANLLLGMEEVVAAGNRSWVAVEPVVGMVQAENVPLAEVVGTVQHHAVGGPAS